LHYIKPIYSVLLAEEPDEKTRLEVGFTKEYSLNSYYEDLFDNWKIDSLLKRQISRKTTAFLSCFYGEGIYKFNSIKNAQAGIDGGFTYNIGKNSSTDLIYGYSQMKANDPSNEYKKNRLLLKYTFGF
jgi:hypothetical protein